MAKTEQHEWKGIIHPAKYWKIPPFHKKTKPELQAYLTRKKYHFHKNDSKDRLIELTILCHRGLPSYHGCSISELEGFARARQLPVQTCLGKNIDIKRAYLVSALEYADDQRTFHRFADLPAELRVRIYQLHFKCARFVYRENSSSMHHRPMLVATPPPITEGSRLLRREALPVFYQVMDPIITEISYMHGSKFSRRFINHSDDGHVKLIRQVTFMRRIAVPATVAPGGRKWWCTVLRVKPGVSNHKP